MRADPLAGTIRVVGVGRSAARTACVQVYARLGGQQLGRGQRPPFDPAAVHIDQRAILRPERPGGMLV